MVDPPARNTVMNTQRAGKYLKQCDTGPVNWSDKANFCGGKGVSLCDMLTHLCLASHKIDIGKQCRPGSDVTERTV